MCDCTDSWKNNERLKASLEAEQANASKRLLVSIDIDIPGSYSLKDYRTFLAGPESEKTPDTVHDNLWEQARLNMNIGLYRVTDSPQGCTPNADGRFPVATGNRPSAFGVQPWGESVTRYRPIFMFNRACSQRLSWTVSGVFSDSGPARNVL